MTMQLYITLLLITGLGQAAAARHFTPTLSLLTNYTFTTNDNQVRAGIFDISNRKTNLGLELTDRFNLCKHTFVRTGIRVSRYKTYISGRNQMPEMMDDAYPVYWQRTYSSVTIPVQVGRGFKTKKGRNGDYFIGGSAGILATGSLIAGVRSLTARSNNFADTVSASITQTGDLTPSWFIATADAGINYHPFKRAQQWSVGLLCSAVLNKTGAFTYQGTVTNESKHTSYNYDLTHRMQMMNLAVTISYRFGKQRS